MKSVRPLVKTLSTVSAAVSMATVMASSSQASAGIEDKSVILLQPTEECAYCADYLKFFKKDATEAGFKFETVTSAFDPANQANQVEQAIAKRPDAIILWPVDVNALIPSMRKIKKAGIPLIISDAMPAKQSEPYWDVYTGGNSEEIGRESAHALVDAFKAKGHGEEGEIFVITGTPGTPTSIGRTKGFKEELAKIAPGIKILGEQPGNWDQNVAMNAASTLFTRFGDQVDGVYAVEDLMLAGVIVAAARANIDPTKLALVGVGCELEGYENIDAGVQHATVLSDAYSDAKYAVNAAVKLLNGEPQDKYTYLPNPIVTKETLDLCHGALANY
ncbi:sugar ABC transporter substrate-binding protein [Rhodanobacter aciditrophus]|uniref:Sugar ABC transporter substrate-binding protein n=1 Tax=Rhodanobacter aciditrophus TaxID=1623218 RepID=A0ABW4B225_9GAMM